MPWKTAFEYQCVRQVCDVDHCASISMTMAWVLPGVLGAQSPAEHHEALRWACCCWRLSAEAGRAGRLMRSLLAQTPPAAPQQAPQTVVR